MKQMKQNQPSCILDNESFMVCYLSDHLFSFSPIVVVCRSQAQSQHTTFIVLIMLTIYRKIITDLNIRNVLNVLLFILLFTIFRFPFFNGSC